MYGLTSSGGSTILPSGADATKKCICSIFIPKLFALTWIYDVETCTTRALCWADESTMLMIQNLLGQQTALVSHSIFSAVIGAITLGYVVDCRLGVQSRSISKVENRINHHGWTKPTVPDVAKGKYALLSANMSGSAMSLAGLQRRS